MRRGKTPGAAPSFNVFGGADRQELENRLADGAPGVLVAVPPEAPGTQGSAIDAKTLQGSARRGAPGVHRLSALSHRLGLTLGQQAVEDKANQIGAPQQVLAGLVLTGGGVTVPALLRQRALAETIRRKGGTLS